MRKSSGFTLIELLVVIVIIGLLATMVIVNVSQARVQARDTRRKADIRTIQNALEMYAQRHEGSYPKTQTDPLVSGGGHFVSGSWVQYNNQVNADPGCTRGTTRETGTNTTDWIPELVAENFLSSLPKDPLPEMQYSGEYPLQDACYMYQSDGDNYVLSAWNTVETGPKSAGDDMFSQAGFREMWTDQQIYFCNHPFIVPYYKYSYTLTNMKCP